MPGRPRVNALSRDALSPFRAARHGVYLLGATLIYGAFGALDTKSPRLCRGMLARPSIKYLSCEDLVAITRRMPKSVRNKIQLQTRPLIRAHQQHACFLYRETSSKTPLLRQSARRRERVTSSAPGVNEPGPRDACGRGRTRWTRATRRCHLRRDQLPRRGCRGS